MKEKKDRLVEQKYLFHQGRDYRSYELFGAHPLSPEEGKGIRFRVWAPRAVQVSLVGDFNGWDIEADPMKRLSDDATIWELTTDKLGVGWLYKYAIRTDDGRVLMKADPFAFESEKGSTNDGIQMASRVSDIAYGFEWHDDEWLRKRNTGNHYREPINIYEVHLGSWKLHEDGSFYTFAELADELIPYVKDMGYTHIEMLPVMEHPFGGSWGYQVTGYYSVTSRYGTPADFKNFVDRAHQAGIGVIMDWVPAHFPKDSHGLIEFDGYCLYEDSDPFKREHKGWGTLAFDFGRPEVQSFLISNAFFFCDVYHIDGLRVDAVAAMLYLDYGREPGEWHPNEDGGRENKQAVDFLRNMNRDVLSSYPGVMTIAEESTAWPMVTKPPSAGGLGFNFKWNMGWMNDTLEYFKTDPFFRKHVHNKLTFAMTYAYSENYILPISHDEVVHGKCSLLNKMPGSYDDKFSGARAFLIYMMTHPGKKLIFMGSEFGQFIEWNENKGLDWLLLGYDRHRQIQEFVKALNKVYLDSPELWETDDTMDGFRWIDADNAADNVYTYMRMDRGDKIEVVALNLSGRSFPEYDIGVPMPDENGYSVKIDSDDIKYGGTGSREDLVPEIVKEGRNWFPQHIKIPMPAYSGIILECIKCIPADEEAEEADETEKVSESDPALNTDRRNK